MASRGCTVREHSSAARMRWLRIAFREHNPCKPKPVTPLPTRPIYRPIRWTDYPSGGRGRYGRSRTGGRPWDFYVLHHPLPSRPLTQRQARLLRLWRLDKPLGRPFMCNLLIAEQRVRLHFLACGVSRAHLNDVVLRTSLCPTTRDSLRLAYMPGDVCHTITRSNANLNWVCGVRRVHATFTGRLPDADGRGGASERRLRVGHYYGRRRAILLINHTGPFGRDTDALCRLRN